MHSLKNIVYSYLGEKWIFPYMDNIYFFVKIMTSRVN